MADFIKKQVDKKIALVIVITVFLIALLAIILYSGEQGKGLSFSLPIFEKIKWPKIPEILLPVPEQKLKGIKRFASAEEFKEYLQSTADLGLVYGDGLSMAGAKTLLPAPTAVPEGMGGGAETPERISETNVQVAGVDEPDIVKTDGKEIYFSPALIYRYWEVPVATRGGIMPPYPYQQPKINAIKAFPPSDLSVDAKIDKTGDLLLNKNILVIFSNDKIYGYNVSNPKSPEKKWEVDLENNNYIVASRLYQGKIYLVTKTTINEITPCPIKPLSVNGSPITIACTEIYHPILPVPVDTTFVAMVVNPDTGKVEKNISFVGSSGTSLVYMSEKAIYATYYYNESVIRFYSNFLKEKAKDLFPLSLINKIEKLDSYDISESSKFMEFGIIFQNYLNSLNQDEILKIENEMNDRMSDYYAEHMRELEKTGIVKIALEGFELKASGNVAGSLLNQFALDEYNDYLRIATTIGQGSWGMGFAINLGRTNSANDVYVLDNNLQIQGSVKNLGLTERIYSARFIEDKGYLVTFRQTDPFYVLDLSNPKNPQLKGELKIPGYSSYLHPITKDKILGIGQENWQVKISLFDVSSPVSPSEKDKYILNESWSDISNTHHAFLLDSKHQIFFLPGGQGGYVFSYKNDKLELKRAVSNISAKRAIYINDYLYIIGDNKIVVLNENTWEKTNELEL